MDYRMKRRTFLGTSFAAGMTIAGLSSCSRSSQAESSQTQAKNLVTACYLGNWEAAHREIIVPAFKRATGIDVTLTPLLAVDQIARLKASPGMPPFDVTILDPGPLYGAPKEQILQKFPTQFSKNYSNLLPRYQNTAQGWGPTIAVQFCGIAYNPKKVTTPPTSWADLWKPEYKGRVGIANMNSTLGAGWLVEIAKMNGGSESNVEPAFAALQELRPNLAAVAANPGALSTLFQQGEVDIAPHNLSSTAALRDKGVDIDWVAPKEGAFTFGTTMHVVKNPVAGSELSAAYIDTVLSAEVQRAISAKPYYFAPTNKTVELTGVLAEKVGTRFEDYDKFVSQDWDTISKHHAQWIEQFNKEIAV